MQPDFLRLSLGRWAALLIALAGLIHLVILPEHWDHAPAHGLLFAIAGLGEIAWGIAAWHRPSAMLFRLGLILAVWLVVLWGITRLIAAPFGHGPEAVDTIGVVCKLCETLGVVVLGLLVFQNAAAKSGRSFAWRTLALLVIAAFLAAFVVYGVARASEPVLPWLHASEENPDHEKAPGTEQHNHETAPETEHQHEAELTPVP